MVCFFDEKRQNIKDFVYIKFYITNKNNMANY